MKWSLLLLSLAFVGVIWPISSAIAADEQPTPPAKQAAAEGEPKWIDLFDGKKLGEWQGASFGGEGEIEVRDGQLILPRGEPLTAATLKKSPFKIDYEIELDAQKVDGNDFFCGLTFPIGDDPCTLIVGGWSGAVVGLSRVNGRDAVENETTTLREFKTGQWYHIRLRVQKERIQAWIDKDQVVNCLTKEKTFSIRMSVEPCVPLGIASYQTTAALKNIRMRSLNKKPAADETKP